MHEFVRYFLHRPARLAWVAGTVLVVWIFVRSGPKDEKGYTDQDLRSFETRFAGERKRWDSEGHNETEKLKGQILGSSAIAVRIR
jgi:hypothetical protein